MPKKIVYLLLAVSLGLNVGVIATTVIHQTRAPQGPPSGPGGDPGGGPGRAPNPERLVDDHVRGMTAHLDLDADQQQAIRAILERHAPMLVEYQAEVAATGMHLSDAYAAPAFDPQRFRELAAAASNARSRLDSLSAVMLVGEAAELTPEQRRKFAEVAPMVHSRPQPPRPPQREGRPPPR